MRTAPGSDTQWHHHGTYDTYVYGISGKVRAEWGPGGKQSWEDELSGAFVHVPAGVVHREINPGDTENEVLVVRVGTGGPPVVPVEGPGRSSPRRRLRYGRASHRFASSQLTTISATVSSRPR